MADALPLDGIRVFDATNTYAGPTCARVLADLGAEVIHVEGLRRMDLVRLLVVADNTVGEDYWNWGGYFMKRNLGKRDLAINLDRPEGREAALRVISTCDVFLESYAPRVMRGFGLDYQSVREVRPDIVYCSLSGYGQSGPYRDWVAYGMGLEPASGISSLTGYPGEGPLRSGISLTDPLSGLIAAYAVLAALHERRRTGRGQYIDLSEHEAAIPLVGRALLAYQLTGRVPERQGNRSPDAAPQGIYPCADEDGWVAVSVQDDAEWHALCDLLGRADWRADPGLATRDGRAARHDELDAGIAAWTRGRDKAEAMRALQAAGVTAGAVLHGKDLLWNEQLAARDFFDVVEDPRAGKRPFPRQLPVRFSRFQVKARGPAPLLGQHNREVLRDLGGLTDQEIDALEAAGVAGTAPEPALPAHLVRIGAAHPVQELIEAGAFLRVEPDYKEQLSARFGTEIGRRSDEGGEGP